MWNPSNRRPSERYVVVLSFLAAIFSADPGRASAKKTQAPPVDVPSVRSTDQRNGVTAGYVNNLNQTVLPTLVRGPQLEKFKAAFTAGAKLKHDFRVRNETDDDISALCARSEAWANDTYHWLNADVSEYAGERFLFRPPAPTYDYGLGGQHEPAAVLAWYAHYEALSAFLVNLDQLMRDPSIYPEPGAK